MSLGITHLKTEWIHQTPDIDPLMDECWNNIDAALD